jgi:hypothetical protein
MAKSQMFHDVPLFYKSPEKSIELTMFDGQLPVFGRKLAIGLLDGPGRMCCGVSSLIEEATLSGFFTVRDNGVYPQ